MSPSDSISVSRKIPASADAVFAVLVDPGRHPEIDGSGMLRRAMSVAAITKIGDTFAMGMRNEIGEYEMINHVVEYEPSRRIAWEPALRTVQAEGEGDAGVRAGHRWCYELQPLGSNVTLVTERYDCSSAPAWLQKAVDGGRRWQASMEQTLENLERLCSANG